MPSFLSGFWRIFNLMMTRTRRMEASEAAGGDTWGAPAHCTIIVQTRKMRRKRLVVIPGVHRLNVPY